MAPWHAVSTHIIGGHSSHEISQTHAADWWLNPNVPWHTDISHIPRNSSRHLMTCIRLVIWLYMEAMHHWLRYVTELKLMPWWRSTCELLKSIEVSSTYPLGSQHRYGKCWKITIVDGKTHYIFPWPFSIVLSNYQKVTMIFFTHLPIRPLRLLSPRCFASSQHRRRAPWRPQSRAGRRPGLRAAGLAGRRTAACAPGTGTEHWGTGTWGWPWKTIGKWCFNGILWDMPLVMTNI